MNSVSSPTEIAIILVHYRGVRDVLRCTQSLMVDPPDDIVRHVIVVDNEGSATLQNELTAAMDGRLSVTVLVPDSNTGFAGGNNFGWEHVQQHLPNVEFVALLNQDTTVDPAWDTELVHFLHSEPQAAAAQARILLMDQPTKLNTRGNKSHYLGFGFVDGYLEDDDPAWTTPNAISFASGCAVMLRRSVLEQIGLFDPAFFMYCEDMDLGWSIQRVGYQNYVVPRSVVWHDYQPTAPQKAYFYLERNRWLLVLSHYSWWTLLVLSPAFAFMECGQWLYAFSNGLLRQRLRVYADLLTVRQQKHITARRAALRGRTASKGFAGLQLEGRIQTAVTPSPLLRYIANPILAAWWHLAKKLIQP